MPLTQAEITWGNDGPYAQIGNFIWGPNGKVYMPDHFNNVSWGSNGRYFVNKFGPNTPNSPNPKPKYSNGFDPAEYTSPITLKKPHRNVEVDNTIVKPPSRIRYIQ